MKFFHNKDINFKSVLIIILSTLLIGLFIALYFYFKTISKQPIPAFKLIPSNAAVIIKIKNPLELYKNQNNQSEIWKQLKNDLQMQAYFNQLDCYDSLSKKSVRINNLLSHSDLLLSISVDRSDSINFFFVLPLSKEITENDLNKFMLDAHKQNFLISKSSDINIASSKANKNNKFYWTFYEQNMLISNSNKLIYESKLKNINHNWLDKDKLFENIYKSSGKSVDANIFINHKEFGKLFQLIFPDFKFLPNHQFKNYAAWSELDYSFSENTLFFNGFTNSSDSLPQLLSILKIYQSQNNAITDFLPSNTAFFAQYIAQPKDFIYKHKPFAENLDIKYNTSINNDLMPLFDNEIAKAYVNKSILDTSISVLHIIKAKSRIDLLNYYTKLAKLNNISFDSLSFLNYKIYINPIKEFPDILFDNTSSNKYFTTISNYFIFGKELNSIKYLIFNYVKENSIVKSENFINNKSNFSKTSNIFFYWNPYKSSEIINILCKNNRYKIVNIIKNLFASCNNIFLQLEKQKEQFYTNLQISINKNTKYNDCFQWNYACDTLFSKNLLVFNSSKLNGEKLIAISDVLNNVYLLTQDGKLIWKKKIEEQIIGEFNVTYSPKSNKAIIFFNTANKIWAYQTDGKILSNFPIILSDKTNGNISVFNYNNKDQIRILCPTTNNTILNYDLYGKKVKGWVHPLLKHQLIDRLSFIENKKLELIYGLSNDGDVVLLDRKGKLIQNKIKTQELKIKGKIYPIITEDKSGLFFAAITKDNDLVKIDVSGNVNKINFNNTSKNSQLISFSFSGIKPNMIAIANGNSLYLLNHKFETLKQFSFSESSIKNIYFSKESNTIIVYTNNNKVYFISQSTQNQIGFNFNDLQKIWTGNFIFENEKMPFAIMLSSHEIKGLLNY